MRANGLPRVSVVIPVYNKRRQLPHVLASLCRQTVSQELFEVIVVDDGSTEDILTDSSPALERLPHYELIRLPSRRGAAGARNAGASRARGDILLFLDADCVAHPDLLGHHLGAQITSRIAASGYTYAQELTPSTWSLLFGHAWSFDDVTEVFSRAEARSQLHDFRPEELTEPRETDWAYFWTTNVSIRASDFARVGGFCEDFAVKGVEDMEIGLRLSRAGTPTVFLPEAQVFHQLHERDRHGELLRDRRNEFLLLCRHPDLEVEVVCSFGIANARRLWPFVRSIADWLDPATVDCGRLRSLSGVVEILRRSRRTAVLGESDGWPDGVSPPTVACHPAAQPGRGPANGTERLRLLGTRLPFDDGTFDVVLVTDYWRLLPERTLCRVLDEAARCGHDVVLLDGVSTAGPLSANQALNRALAVGDAPFWEFTFPLRRELHQFHFAQIDQAPTGESRALSVRPITWPSQPFAGVLDGELSRRSEQDPLPQFLGTEARR